MTAGIPSTEVFAFSAPKVKAGEVAIAVRVPAGLHALTATRSVWHGLFRHLELFFTAGEGAAFAAARPPPPPPAPRALKNRGSKSTYGSSAKKCAVAWADLAADLTQTVRAVAARHGIVYATLGSWINTHHRGELLDLRRAAGISRPRDSRNGSRAASAGAPLLKPNGRIL